MEMNPIRLEHIPVSEIRENPLNRLIFNELGEDQYAALKAYIKKVGVRKPLILNEDNILLAGHARLKICRELGIEKVQIQRMRFPSPSAEAEFLIADNMLTRTLSPIETARAGMHLEQSSRKYQKLGRPMRDIVAEKLGISSFQYSKAKAIISSGDLELVQRVDQGSISVNRAYEIIRSNKQKETLRRKAQAEGPRFRLVNEDPMAALSNFKSDSCDCVIAEPPSDVNPIWADLCGRALKENGSLFVMTQRNFPAISEAMQAGFKLVLPICVLTRTHQDGSFVYNHLTAAWLSKTGRGRPGAKDHKVSSVWDMRAAVDPIADVFSRMIELTTEPTEMVIHLYGDNRPILDLADLLERNIFAVQPVKDNFLREKLNV